MEYGRGGGGSHSPGEHHQHDHDDGSDSQRRNKRYHRHTSNQIQRLESMFKECPHPDEKQRMQLSRELGLAPRQIKFWFQNRRTQLKAQHERQDNSTLRSENDKIRCENIAFREALKNCVCPNCGPAPLNEDSYFDDQKMRLENLHLKEELDRVSSIAAKYIGRPISQLPSILPIHMSPLELSMGTSPFGIQQGLFGIGADIGSSLDLDLLQGTCSNSMPNFPYQPGSLSEMDKSHMSTIATNALEEFLRLLHTNDPLWIKSTTDGKDVLNLEIYERMFPKTNTHLKNPNFRVEASRDSVIVMMNSSNLAEMFMDANKWRELFSTIVSAARTIEVLSSGIMGGNSGSLQLMYEELQVLSPHVSTREFYFLRYLQQIEQGTWAIVDVSYDFPQDNQFAPQFPSHRFPSGCLIQDFSNGQSKVTWIEHVEVEDKTLPHRFFRNLIYSGLAFGSERWVATLQRTCERIACLMVTPNPTRDLGGAITSPEGKRSTMKLSQRMVTSFCANISTSNGQKWTILSGLDEVGVRVSIHKSTDPGQPNGVVLSAATTIWVPIPPHIVFNFFKDDRKRPQWDVLSNGNPVQEVAHIANGSHPGNRISILRAFNTTQNNNMLILQESCIDSSGAIVVYCPVDLPSMNIAMNGEDPSYIPLLPSGFSISHDGQHDQGGVDGGVDGGASTSSNTSTNIGRCGGSLVTVAFQILVSNLPSAKLNMDSVTTVNNLISTTIHQIKASLNCPSS
ncbi:putative transcription factor & lipid binding HD-SAD family [Lupinus albus]|uniref:Putative transcription factor & lipid binding HD-SAD family n=1 Tax=Lupinus albus TaxID=3870 RepID=A0A6A4NUY0_LUPAL|nr:putative transcription factor & lipid binding HD-SAD family [Lupinus albus]